MSFFSSTSKPVVDIRSFLRDAAGGNSVKYATEKGAKHQIYFPFKTQVVIDEATGQQVEQRVLCAYSGNVHEWTTADNKYKATICAHGMVVKDQEGNVLNDGTCPICDRINDAWGILNYRYEQEDAKCQLTGEERKKHLETSRKDFMDQLKAKKPRTYMYILVAVFKLNDQNQPIIENGKPVYKLQVMKLSDSRVKKIEEQVKNAGIDNLAGTELIFSYPATDDAKVRAGQCTTSPVFSTAMMTARYPDVLNSIMADIEKFDWECLPKAFSEWEGMTTQAAKLAMDSAFQAWDAYQQEKLANPTAKYLEYTVQTPTEVPSTVGVGIGAIPAPQIPQIPQGAPQVAQQAPVIPNPAPTIQMPSGVPQAPVIPGVPQAPVIPAPTVPTQGVDPNSVFAGVSPTPANI